MENELDGVRFAGNMPVEFARQSKDGRITLVVTGSAKPVPVLWSRLATDSLEHAQKLLAVREEVPDKYTGRSIGLWSISDRMTWGGAAEVAEWATTAGFDAAVWPALGPKFLDSRRCPSSEEVIDYFGSLEG